MLRNRNGTQAVPYVSQNWGDLLKSYDKRPIMRDSIGNPTNDFVWRYTWQHGRQLASMTKLDGSAHWNYTYNADGLRTQRTDTVSGRTYNYTYNGDKLTHMTVDGHTMYFTYDASGVPLTMVYDGNKFYYVTNLQGDVISIINGNGQEFVRYTYDAWGKLLSVDGTATNLRFYNPLRYRGYVYDEETGLYYLQSRYYNPEMGRFINADKVIDTRFALGNNIYTYCLNNPLKFVDHSGKSVLAIIVVTLPLVVFGPNFSIQSAASNEPYLADNDVPYHGEPGSHVVSQDGTKERIYGPDGLPERDRHHTDHGNPKKHPHVPHDHDWGYNEKGQWAPGPGYKSPTGPLQPKTPPMSYNFEFEMPSISFLNPYTGDVSFAEIVIDFFISLFQ